jgi:uncharacterized protein YggE
LKTWIGLALLAVPAAGLAQVPPVLEGTRLDVTATGEVTRVPDIARISAGVVTQAATASAALTENGARMSRVLAALRRAGVADRDVRTSAISLNPSFRFVENQPPVLTGYQAVNQVTIRFRDVKTSGTILDTLVSEGANEINGPSLEIERPEPALDEARVRALATARARGELFANAAGMRIARIVSISDNSSAYQPPVRPYGESRAMMDAATKIVPGEQAVQASVSVTFELR